ncbi:MAG: endopeptidase La [Gemmatimonadetes bacterium]|nr:endopeptidase La [Gemmatimonadota bacterium]
MVLPLLIGRPRSTAALRQAEAAADRLLLLVAQKDPEQNDAAEEDVFRIGTVARAIQVTPLPDGTCRVVLEGIGRARVERFAPAEDGALAAEVRPFAADAETAAASPDLDALGRGVARLFEEYARLNERVPEEIPRAVVETKDRVRLAHLVAGHLLVPSLDKQPVLEAPDATAALGLLRQLLARELEILRIEEKLDHQIRLQLDSERKHLYLNEQLKAIHRELGADSREEWEELEELLRTKELPPHARERAERELGRLRKLNPISPEAAVIRTYVDWILALPWSARGADSADVARAARVLEEAHHGLGEVKERILDHIAVLSLVGELKGPILCLAGPPGVGKTSLGRSIARALDREFVRVSLGGIRDEAEIRGHRRTYVGALPGRILQGMRKSGTKNPVFMLDEVDKLARDFHGDPGAALLEVLDPEQNKSFADHYLELEFDLSDVLFVATANTLQGIPEPLRDRMEIIRLPGYLDTEKRTIARRFLWPRQAERHGISADAFTLDDDALDGVIHNYTREAGVRELDRRIGRITRKLARQVADGVTPPATLGHEQVRALLGPPPYLPPDHEDELDRSGIARGLAWTSAGGEVLDVEVAVVPGSGEVRLTGTLGDVMKESAMAAVTYARSRAHKLGLDVRFHRDVDIHIHLPEGATPKDGPSAGITIAVALISALTNTPTLADVAMTGEITLRGRVLGVGGIKEKAVAALRYGVRRVLLPAANVPELELLPQEVRDGIEFVPVRMMDDVLSAALATVPGPRMAEGVRDILSGGAELGSIS